MPLVFLGQHTTHVAHVAAAVNSRVAVQHLAPLAGERHPDAVVVIDVRRKIDDHEAACACVVALADPGEYVAAGIVGDSDLAMPLRGALDALRRFVSAD